MTLQTIVQVLLGLSLIPYIISAFYVVPAFLLASFMAPIFLPLVIILPPLYPILVLRIIYKIHATHSLFPLAFILLALAVIIFPYEISLITHGMESVRQNKENDKIKQQKDIVNKKIFDTASRDFVCPNNEFLTIQGKEIIWVNTYGSDHYQSETVGTFLDAHTVKQNDRRGIDRLGRDCKNKDGKTVFDIYNVTNI